MTLEDHLRLLLGDMAFRIAQLAAEVDTLKAQLAAKEATHGTP